jgi:putative hydrolase of the HAD superfamily
MALTVVFDFGAVLFHWRPADLVRRRWPELAPDDAAALALAERFFGGFQGDWAEFDRGTLDRDGIVSSIVARTGWSADLVASVVDEIPHSLVVDPATVDLLRNVWAAGIRTAYLSNMPAPYASVLEERHQFLEGFDGGLFSSRVGLVKPEPALFRLLEQTMGLDPTNTVLIDDSPPNVEAARRLGWRAVLYRDAADCRRQLAASGLPV